MQPIPSSNLPATHQPGSRQPERRMTRRRSPRRAALKPLSDCPVALLGPVCVALRGRIGTRVYKTYGEKIIITRMPSFGGYVPSPAQRKRREQMRAATAFAKAVYADPSAKAVYVAAAKALGRQPFRLAISDFLHGRMRVSIATGQGSREEAKPRSKDVVGFAPSRLRVSPSPVRHRSNRARLRAVERRQKSRGPCGAPAGKRRWCWPRLRRRARR